MPRPAVTRRTRLSISEARSIHLLRASHFTPRSLLRLRHRHRNRYSLTSPLGAQRNNEGRLGLMELIKFAFIIVASVPVLCIYPFVYKHFIKGVMIGSLKG